MALSGYAREHASLSIGSINRRQRAYDVATQHNDIDRRRKMSVWLRKQASRFKWIEAWIALEGSQFLRGLGLARLRYGLCA